MKINAEVLRRWLREKKFPGVKLGGDWRIQSSSINDFLEKGSFCAELQAISVDDGPKMCGKFPKWVEYSGLPRLLFEEIGSLGWPIFKKLIEIDFEKQELYDRAVFFSLDDLSERLGYPIDLIEKTIEKLNAEKYIEIGSDPKKGRFYKIKTPVRSPKLIIDIDFEKGGAKGAPEKALRKNCLRRYLEFS
ncbi:MAG: helix-turn-helix domain-containing protein [Candidatus Riflebacteria bacterium]|nr:helix-turn-helix domain-containing protein [Candidatus Riflebacteria bacterium]